MLPPLSWQGPRLYVAIWSSEDPGSVRSLLTHSAADYATEGVLHGGLSFWISWGVGSHLQGVQVRTPGLFAILLYPNGGPSRH